MKMKDTKALAAEFAEELKQIAEDCEAEGYPAHGENYDLRVDNLMRDPYYADLFDTEEVE
jgi:hypothetical protein